MSERRRHPLAGLMAEVALRILGEPSKEKSSKDQWRYGNKGSLSVNFKDGTWYDHEIGNGGGVLDLIRQYHDKPYVWLREQRLINDRTIVEIYNYHDESNNLLYQTIMRTYANGSKKPSMRRHIGNNKFEWSKGCMQNVRRVLYKLPELIAGKDSGNTVYIPEGERHVDRLIKLGLRATCNPNGAGSWSAKVESNYQYSDHLRDENVCILPDNDPQSTKDGEPLFHDDGRPRFAGQDHAEDIARNLCGKAKRIRVLMLPNLPPKGDVLDWLDKLGGTRDELLRLADETPDWVPPEPTPGPTTNKIIEAIEIRAGVIETYKVVLASGGAVVVGAEELNYFPFFNRACIAMARRSFEQPDEDKEAWWSRQVDSALRAAKVPENPSEEIACWHGSPEWKKEPPSWSIRERIPEQGVGLLSGAFSMFKSFQLLDASASIMTGLPWLGARVVRRGGVLIFAAEGAKDIPMRMAAIVEHKLTRVLKNKQPKDLFNPEGIDLKRLPFSYIPSCRPLLDPKTVDWIIEKAGAAQDKLRVEFGLDLTMIGIDTMSAAAGWESESDAAQVQIVMNHLADVSKATGAFVLACDHFGKVASLKSRGSSVKEASADTILDALGEKAEDGTVIDARLVLRKQRSGPQGLTFPFEAKLVDMGVDHDGEPLTSRIIDWSVARPEKTKVKPRAQKLIEQVLAESLSEHGEQIKVQGDPISGEMEVRAVKKDVVRFAFKKAYQVEHPDANADAVGEAFRRAARQANLILKTHVVDGVEFLTATPV